mmetsp:Transcript_14932/g.39416  ORF Transcript_14932/g.39416 Transcript_14932/m.39416 type:complete len:218 (-) Transcript_14932:81-734(-)
MAAAETLLMPCLPLLDRVTVDEHVHGRNLGSGGLLQLVQLVERESRHLAPHGSCHDVARRQELSHKLFGLHGIPGAGHRVVTERHVQGQNRRSAPPVKSAPLPAGLDVVLHVIMLVELVARLTVGDEGMAREGAEDLAIVGVQVVLLVGLLVFLRVFGRHRVVAGPLGLEVVFGVGVAELEPVWLDLVRRVLHEGRAHLGAKSCFGDRERHGSQATM